MKRLLLIALLLTAAPARAADGDGFVPLFNGKDLDGWEVKDGPKGQWSVKDGVLTAKPGNGWLGTKKQYGDFVLRLEWRLPANGNSGVYLRVPDVKTRELPTFTGMEIQVLDDTGTEYKGKLKAWQYSGSIYGVVPAGKAVYKGAGKWNRFEITCKGDRVEVVFNGVKVAAADMGKEAKLAKRPRRGFLGLQNHGSAVEYRNVRIKVLDRPAAPAPRDKAINQALDYLKKAQAADGHWIGRGHKNPAVTGLAVMAFLSAGHRPGKGPYGDTIDKGLRAVLKAQLPNGLIATRGGQEMYQHGIATLLLAQVADCAEGKLRDEVRKALDKAVALILKAQRQSVGGRGGWRYMVLDTGSSDMSVTGWQVLALQAARRAGCDVPRERLDRAVAFIRRCRDARLGGYCYMPHSRVTLVCTQGGILGMVFWAKDGARDPDVARAGAYLLKNPLRWGASYFSDALYHGAHVAAVLGKDHAAALDKLLEDVLKRQNANGLWPAAGSDRAYGPNYVTAMTVLALTARDRRLVPFREEKVK